MSSDELAVVQGKYRTLGEIVGSMLLQGGALPPVFTQGDFLWSWWFMLPLLIV